MMEPPIRGNLELIVILMRHVTEVVRTAVKRKTVLKWEEISDGPGRTIDTVQPTVIDSSHMEENGPGKGVYQCQDSDGLKMAVNRTECTPQL